MDVYPLITLMVFLGLFIGCLDGELGFFRSLGWALFFAALWPVICVCWGFLFLAMTFEELARDGFSWSWMLRKLNEEDGSND